jgi:hypothetical protein
VTGRARTPAAAGSHSKARIRLATAGLLAGLYRGLIWPRFRRWGATDEELRVPLPGADLVPGSRRGGTMAVTIDAAPEAEVWSWLVQMGCDRAGWYSWDRLDNGGRPSGGRIHPEWQRVAVGDRWPSMPSGRSWFEVAALDPERFLGLRAPLRLDGRPFDPAGPRPRFYSDSSWGFLLNELSGGRTRLLVSGYAASSSGADRDRRPAVLGAGALDHADPPAGQPHDARGARSPDRWRHARAGARHVSRGSGVTACR